MAMKTDFNNSLISVLDEQQLFIAMKNSFMSHEKFMGSSEAMKIVICNIHGP